MNKRNMIHLLDQVVFSGSSFLITLLLAQSLEINAFGKYAGFVLANYLLVSGIGAFTIQPFQVLLGRITLSQAYISFTFWLHITAVIVSIVLGFAALLIMPYAFPISLIGFSAGFIMHDFGRRLLLAIDKPLHALLLDSLLAMLTLIALLTHMYTKFQSLHEVLIFLSLPYAASFVLLLFFIKPIRISKATISIFGNKHWLEGKWLFLTAVSQWWSGNLFVVASGFYLGAAALGALRLAQSLMGILNIFLQSFENYLLPQTALRMRTTPSDGINYLARISRKAAMMFIPALVIVFVFAEQILVLAGGPAYAAFAFALQGMALLYMLVFLSQPIRLLVRALLLHQHFFYGYLFSLVFAILCSHALLSEHGLMGAIIGLSVSQIILIIYWTFILQKRNIPLWKSFISY